MKNIEPLLKPGPETIYTEFKNLLKIQKSPALALEHLKTHRSDIDINACFEDRESLLYLAIKYSRAQDPYFIELFRYLLREGIDVNLSAGEERLDDDEEYSDDTALMELLGKSNFHQKNWTESEESTHAQLVNELLEAGADVDIQSGMIRSMPLLACVRHVRSIEIFKKILSLSKMPDPVNFIEGTSYYDGDWGRYNAAHCAGESGHIEHLQILLDLGCDFQAMEARNEETPMSLLWNEYPALWCSFMEKNPKLYELELAFVEKQIKTFKDFFKDRDVVNPYIPYLDSLIAWNDRRQLMNDTVDLPTKQDKKSHKL